MWGRPRPRFLPFFSTSSSPVESPSVDPHRVEPDREGGDSCPPRACRSVEDSDRVPVSEFLSLSVQGCGPETGLEVPSLWRMMGHKVYR